MYSRTRRSVCALKGMVRCYLILCCLGSFMASPRCIYSESPFHSTAFKVVLKHHGPTSRTSTACKASRISAYKSFDSEVSGKPYRGG